jgi:hypothetical protein
MGAFIPSVSDNEICDALNKRFSADRIPNRPITYIQQLKNHAEKLFDSNHHLHRVAHRLSVSVTGGASVPAVKKHRLRWFHLLHRLLPPETDAAIRQVLIAVLDPANNIDKAVFSTRPAPIGLAFELYPQNSGQPYVQTLGGQNVCLLILECKVDQPLPDPQPGTENDPPDRDNGENPISARKGGKTKYAKKPPAKKSTAKKSPAKKSKAKKSKAKKSPAKKAKKSYGKKTTAKKAKKGVKKTKKGKSRR